MLGLAFPKGDFFLKHQFPTAKAVGNVIIIVMRHAQHFL